MQQPSADLPLLFHVERIFRQNGLMLVFMPGWLAVYKRDGAGIPVPVEQVTLNQQPERLLIQLAKILERQIVEG